MESKKENMKMNNLKKFVIATAMAFTATFGSMVAASARTFECVGITNYGDRIMLRGEYNDVKDTIGTVNFIKNGIHEYYWTPAETRNWNRVDYWTAIGQDDRGAFFQIRHPQWTSESTEIRIHVNEWLDHEFRRGSCNFW